MKRNIAFVVSSNNEKDSHFIKAKNHLSDLAKQHQYSLNHKCIGSLQVLVVYEDEMTFTATANCFTFPIGNLGKEPPENDRFLKVEISDNNITIENDYAGSIPVYYSLRKHISLSNIEPCVVFDSETRPKDLSYENIYGYLRYLHFIWDETAFSHINTMLPDTRFVFDVQKLTQSNIHLKSVKANTGKLTVSDKEIASSLYELNADLVVKSLLPYDEVILPLSSGYDSRMILAGLSQDKSLKDRLRCFTYGSTGSVEVEAARLMSKKLGIKWQFIDLPCQFLAKSYLDDTYNVFGSSLHMHGMYQLEFYKEITKQMTVTSNTCLTSGFMTGVPAGQHNCFLNITDDSQPLTKAMNKFSQSKYWTDNDLSRCPALANNTYAQKAEERFRKAFNRFDGEIYQKSIMFDIWTRQRSFISYYPRTFEWLLPTVSPHMNTRYINYFMSLPEQYLNNRRAVELMFSHHYPTLSRIVSNSNGLKSIDSNIENLLFALAKRLRKLKLKRFIPARYANKSFEFDLQALRNCGRESIFPLLEVSDSLYELKSNILDEGAIATLYAEAKGGSTPAYQKIVALQSLAYSLYRNGVIA